MPPKLRLKQPKELSERAAKRPGSPLPAPPPVKKIKVEPGILEKSPPIIPAGTRRQRSRATQKKPVLPAIPEENELDDEQAAESQYATRSQIQALNQLADRIYVVDSASEDTVDSRPSDEDRMDISALVDTCVAQHRQLTDFMTAFMQYREARESPEDDAADEEQEEGDAVPWDESGEEDAVAETDAAPDTERKLLEKLMREDPALVRRMLREPGNSAAPEAVIHHDDDSPADNEDTSEPPANTASVAAKDRAVATASLGKRSQRTRGDPFDGTVSILNSELWAPSLKKMYMQVDPPPRRVTFAGRSDEAEPYTPSFQRWTACTRHFAFFKRLLDFKSNNHYFNLARGRGSELSVVDTNNSTKPLRYLARDGSNTPALFISLVEVLQCNLVRPVKIAPKTQDGWLDKKVLVANWFSQEFDLNICNFGEPLDTYSVTIPCWPNRGELCGLTFQTRLSASGGPISKRTARSSLHAPGAAAQNLSKIPIQLYGNQTVPVIDSSVDEFDLSASFSDLRRMPSMQQDPPKGSIGVVFYTVSDTGDRKPLEFNIQGFALLATSPDGSSPDT